MRNSRVYVVAGLLAGFAIALFLYKWLFVGLPLTAGQVANAWQIELDVRFAARGGPVTARVYLPYSGPGQAIREIRLSGTGYGTTVADEGVNRQALYTIRNAGGEQALYARFIVERFPERHEPAIQSGRDTRQLLAPVPADSFSPPPPGLRDTEIAAAGSLVDSARRRSADDASMVSLLIKILTAEPPGESARVLIGENRSARRVAEIATAALVLGGFDARVVNGVDVSKPGRISNIVTWLEVQQGASWRSFSVQTGEPKLPPGYIAWWRGTDPLVTVEGGQTPTRRIAIQRLQQRELDQVLTRGRRADTSLIVYSLYSLPTSAQELFKILVMVPIGIFVLVILRNLIGIKGVGTFMPVLIALAFRETTLAWGLFLFGSITAAGLIARLYLEQLKLLLAPRLAAIVIIVLLMMAVVSVLGHKLGFERGLSVALFPFVILTMTIERISIIWDERGPAAAIREAIQSLVIATVCYAVMGLPGLQYLFFTFPEFMLILLACVLLIGRYSGYRLLELPRFRVLSGRNL